MEEKKMKKIFKYSALIALCSAFVGLAGCGEKELDTARGLGS